MFVSTDGRRACRRGVIGSTMGAYPKDTGSNAVEGNGYFFPSYRQLYPSSFSDSERKVKIYWKEDASCEIVSLIPRKIKEVFL